MTDTIHDSTNHAHVLRELMVDRVDLVPAGSNPGAHIQLFKQRDPASPENQEITMSDKPETPAEETVAKAEFDAAQAELEALREQIAKAEAEASEVEKIRKSLEDAQQEIAKVRQEQREQEYITKAQTEFKNLGSPVEVAKLLIAAEDHFEDAQKQALGRLLKSADAAVEKGDLFAQFSKTSEEVEDLGWEARLAKKAQDLVDSGDCKTIELAKQQVMRNDAAIRADYAKSARGGN